jgi:orotidine-5'-phosphate decarboxylase
MLAAAAEATAKVENGPKLLAVTVLTSIDQEQLKAIGVSNSPADQVLQLAIMAYGAGIRGFVASAEEIQAMRAKLPDATLVIPGIRPAGSSVGDQKRIATPAAAIQAGADYLVVGRPITQAISPYDAAKSILAEIDAISTK